MKRAGLAAFVALALTSTSVTGQAPRPRPLTVLDREGRTVAAVVEAGPYSQPALSSDGARVAVAKIDAQTQNQDIWVFALSTGESTRITSDPAPDSEPAWSPDGSQLVFISRRGGAWGLYRTASNGTGDEELLYRHVGFGGISNLSWSADGQFLIFSDLINISGALYILPLGGDRHIREALRPPLFNTRMSPDGALIAYPSDRSGRTEMYVRPFDSESSAAAVSVVSPLQVSKGGAVGAAFWRRDGRELFYLAPGRGVMAVDVNIVPTLHAGTPKLLLRAPSTRTSVRLASVSSDGDRFIFAVPPEPPVRQLVIVDRQGKEIRAIGKPGPYGQPSLSPDGTKVAVIRNDPETAAQNIWSFEVATGRSHIVTSGPAPHSAPVWSPDGKDIAFVSTRGDYTGVYRKKWNGTGREELLYQHTAGTPSVVLTDWSADGRLLSFYAGDTLYALPLKGKRNATEIERTEFSTIGGRFSPDRRFIAYLSDESGKYEVYVRPFAATADGAVLPTAQRWQISRQGAQGMIFWQQGGKGISYLAADGSVVAVDVATTPTFRVGLPRITFRPQGQGGGGPYGATGNPVQLRNASRDGQRFVFAVQIPAAPSRDSEE
jgi:Tol biopolymer transport system component